jgi:hypothetical protein
MSVRGTEIKALMDSSEWMVQDIHADMTKFKDLSKQKVFQRLVDERTKLVEHLHSALFDFSKEFDDKEGELHVYYDKIQSLDLTKFEK